jgi:hypothetical protein
MADIITLNNNNSKELEEDNSIIYTAEQNNSQYDISKGSPIEKLKLKIGENDISRFHCGNHKLNVAFRLAFELHVEFREILKQLNKSNSYIRNTIRLNKVL